MNDMMNMMARDGGMGLITLLMVPLAAVPWNGGSASAG